MRLISLCPSLTETVFELGRGAALVGRTRYCVEPSGEVEAIEDVGGTKDPDLARIIELAPDLVLLNEEENRLEDHEALTEAGIPCHASFPRGPEDVAPMLRDLGQHLDAAPRARALAAQVEAELAALRATRLERVRFAYLVWRKPWMAAGADTFAAALLEAAGGQNALAGGGERYPTVSAAALADADPALVLLPSEPFPFAARHARELAAATGLPPARLRLVDGQLLSWHGARTRQGLPYARRCLRLD